ncbi:MAG: hypothetical protein AAGB04_30855, partial [Pseudomonadota bacterium]
MVERVRDQLSQGTPSSFVIDYPGTCEGSWYQRVDGQEYRQGRSVIYPRDQSNNITCEQALKFLIGTLHHHRKKCAVETAQTEWFDFFAKASGTQLTEQLAKLGIAATNSLHEINGWASDNFRYDVPIRYAASRKAWLEGDIALTQIRASYDVLGQQEQATLNWGAKLQISSSFRSETPLLAELATQTRPAKVIIPSDPRQPSAALVPVTNPSWINSSSTFGPQGGSVFVDYLLIHDAKVDAASYIAPLTNRASRRLLTSDTIVTVSSDVSGNSNAWSLPFSINDLPQNIQDYL